MPWKGESGCSEMQRSPASVPSTFAMCRRRFRWCPARRRSATPGLRSAARFRRRFRSSNGRANSQGWNMVRVVILPGAGSSHFARFSDCSIGAIARIGVNDSRPIRPQNPLPLRGNVGWYAERDRNAVGRTQHGIGDSGVAAGGVEQSFSRTQSSLLNASATMLEAARSFTDPPGLPHSAFASTCTSSSSAVTREKRKSGVLPIRCVRLVPMLAFITVPVLPMCRLIRASQAPASQGCGSGSQRSTLLPDFHGTLVALLVATGCMNQPANSALTHHQFFGVSKLHWRRPKTQGERRDQYLAEGPNDEGTPSLFDISRKFVRNPTPAKVNRNAHRDKFAECRPAPC